MNLLAKVNAAVAVMVVCATKVAKSHKVAKAATPEWEAILKAEGLAPLTLIHDVGERYRGSDEPLFFDEATNPAPGVFAPIETRDQCVDEYTRTYMEDGTIHDAPLDTRMDFSDSVVACDARWANFLQLAEKLNAAPRDSWKTWKAVEQVLIDEKRAIFGCDPDWNKTEMLWYADSGRTKDVSHLRFRKYGMFAPVTILITCSSQDSRLSLTKGQGNALKTIAAKLMGYDCFGCKSVAEGHADTCYSCDGLAKIRNDYKEYLIRRRLQAVKAAPERRFTDMDPTIRGEAFSVFVDVPADDYVWALVAPWVGKDGRRELVDLLQ